MNIDLTNPQEIEKIVEDIKKDKEQKISELLIEIDKLESEVTAQKHELKEELNNLFFQLETKANTLSPEDRQKALKAIKEIKLKSLEFLGILAQTTEYAIINALERGENIEETIEEITKELTYETIDYQVERKKIYDTASTILDVAATLAMSSVNYSDEILRGAIVGVKKGIKKSIQKFNEIMEYTPDEAKIILLSNYSEIVGDLQNIDKIYENIIQDVANRSDAGIKEKILKITKELNIFEKLKLEAQKTIETIKRKFEHIINDDIVQKAAEAKKLGMLAFEKAKERIDKAIQEAKNAIK
jgi:hypothetical protein